MNLLVTGALGHIGSKLIREYANREDIDIIRILDNFSTQRYCSLFNLPENKTYQFIEGGINNKEDLQKALEDIDIVIHLAAITDAPSTIKKPMLTNEVNFIGTRNLLQAIINSKVQKFLFPSTTSVYGEAEGTVDENTTNLKPQSPYAESKLNAEKAVQDASLKNGLNASILRMGTIFGVSIGMRFHTVVNKFVYLACMNKPLTVWKNAFDQERPYLGLGDCIRAFAFLEKTGETGEIYNVLTKNYTIREIVNIIKTFIPKTKIEMTSSPLLNQKSYHVSNDKIRKLGFSFRDELSKEIEATIRFFRAIKNDQ